MTTDNAYFGDFGGTFAPETLITPLAELAAAYQQLIHSSSFTAELTSLLHNFVGRPTPLTYAENLTQLLKGAQIYFKREDLAHTGAHKINNALGQGLLAKHMGRSRIVAETGAGQHGVATATAAALLGLQCVIYMGEVDMERQALNIARIRLLGAEVVPVSTGTRTLKDAVSEALRDWVTHIQNSNYVMGSVLGPHPYPTIVRDFQTVIGKETQRQIIEQAGQLPDELVACIGGGSNAIGLFYPFLANKSIAMTAVEAGGKGINTPHHAARFASGSVAVFQGTKTYFLQDDHGQIKETYSIAAGLDYPGIGPEHAFLHDTKRVRYTSATDDEVLAAAALIAKTEGIIPALESAHALAYLIKRAPELSSNQVIVVNISGRGDKDMTTMAQHLSL